MCFNVTYWFENYRQKICRGEIEIIDKLKKQNGEIMGEVEKLRVEITEQICIVDNLQKDMNTLTNDFQLLQDTNIKLILDNEILEDKLKSYEGEYEKPDFINTSKSSYIPVVQNVIFTGQGSNWNIEYTQIKDIISIYAVPDRLRNDLKHLFGLSKWKKVYGVWRYVITASRYEFDVGDNAQFPIETIHRKKGDCDDTSILFVAGCCAVGISPEEVFMAVGPALGGYHAYPIVNLKEEDALEAFSDKKKAGWYIFESTLTFLPNGPMKLKGSDYHIDRGGISNWKFAGQVMSEYKKEFNVR